MKTNFCLSLCLMLFIGLATALGQDTQDDIWVERPEAGVKLYGKANRFSAVGNTSSFDSSPDGKTLAFVAGAVKLFDLEANKVIKKLDPKLACRQVRFSPDGLSLFVSGIKLDGTSEVQIFNAITFESTGVKVNSGRTKSGEPFLVTAIVVSDDATYVAMFSHNRLQIHDTRTGELIYALDDMSYVAGACFSPDESSFLFPKNGKVNAIDVTSGNEIGKSELSAVGANAFSMCANFSKNRLAIPSGAKIDIYELNKPGKPEQLDLPKNLDGEFVYFSDDGKLLAVIASDPNQSRQLIVLDVGNNRVAFKTPVSVRGNVELRFSYDNSAIFLSGSGITGIREVLLDGNGNQRFVGFPSGPARNIVVHPDKNAFLSVTRNGEVTVFDVIDGTPFRKTVESNLASIEITERNRDVEIMVANRLSSESSAKLIDFESGNVNALISVNSGKSKEKVADILARSILAPEEPEEIYQQQNSLDAKLANDRSRVFALTTNICYLVFGDDSGTFAFEPQGHTFTFSEYNLESGKWNHRIETKFSGLGFEKGSWPRITSISPDGRQFAVANGNKIFIVATASGEVEVLDESDRSPNGLQYSPDGRFLAVQYNSSLQVFDAKRIKIRYETDQFEAMIGFSADGNRCVVGGSRKNSPIQILNTKTFKPVFSRNKTTEARSCLALSADAEELFIGLKDTRIEAWELSKARQSKSP